MISLVLVVTIQVILQVMLQSRLCSCFKIRGWGHKAHKTCYPEHMLCTHTEQCCAGVCVHRVYMWVVKIKQCTMMDHLECLSPEEQLTYLRSEAIRDNITRLGGRLRMVENPEDIDPRHPLSLIRLVDDNTTNRTTKIGTPLEENMLLTDRN